MVPRGAPFVNVSGGARDVSALGDGSGLRIVFFC